MTQKIFRGDHNENYEYIPVDDSSLVWTTYDLGCSAALLSVGFELLSLDKKDNPRKALFIFKREEGIDESANRYFTDQLEVKARSYFDTVKALKNRIYSE